MKEFSPAFFCPPSWLRYRDAEFDLMHLAALLQDCSANQHWQSCRRQVFPHRFLSAKEKGKYKAFPYERLGLAIHHSFCSFLFFSCRILMEELNRGWFSEVCLGIFFG